MSEAEDPVATDPAGVPHAAEGHSPEADPGQLAEGGGRPQVAAGWDVGADLGKDPALIPDLAEVDVPEGLRQEIEEYMSRYPERHSAALPALAAAQRLHGWCSPEALTQVAAVMRVTPAYLSSVATFYDMLNTQPVGRHYVYVCTSVACHLRNAKAIYDELAATGRDLDDVQIREFECLGACDMAPMASIDGRYVGPLTSEDVPEIVEALRKEETPLPGRALTDPGFSLPWENASRNQKPETRNGEPPAPPSTGAA